MGVRTFVLLGLVAVAAAQEATAPLPIVLWHGMGDTCCAPGSIGGIARHIRRKYGVFVHSIALGNFVEDLAAGYLGYVNTQIEQVCQMLRDMPELRDGYNAIGFSQGGQFLRAVVQRCQHVGPKLKRLVTMGGQHQGVMSIPGCNVLGDMSASCRVMEQAVQWGVYLPTVSQTIVPAQYFKDPFQMEEYLKYSAFLKDVNGDGPEKNATYRENLVTLELFVMVRFRDDETVIPRDSAWFAFYNGSQLVPLQEQDLYKEDWLGLRELDETGRLVFVECPTEHMGFSLDWFDAHVMTRLLPTEPPHFSVT